MSSQLAPKWPNLNNVWERDASAKLKSEEGFRKQHGARPLPELKDGQPVRIKLLADKSWSDSTSIATRSGKNSYLVRNREFLQAVPDDMPRTEEPREETEVRGRECPVALGEERGASAAVEPLPPVPAIVSQENPVPDAANLAGGDIERRTRYGRIVKPVVRFQS
jgi:hypothetical protein